jgi:DNA-binding CsgD family transcriptional regulator
MLMADALQQGRACFERQLWREAHELLSDADREAPLAAEDLDRLAACAHLLGDESASTDLWARAHQGFQTRGDAEQAARCAFRIGFALVSRGQMAHGGGWLARARRLLDDAGKDSPVRGYLLMPDGIRATRAGEPARGYEVFSEALEIGQRFGEADLITWARHGQGRALIKMGRVTEGLALLDESMVAATSGDVLPLNVGAIYCSMIDACTEIFDLRRAHEWTAALSRWCERQPDGLPYRGTCLVRRAEIMRLHGSWADAMDEVDRACVRLLVPPPQPGAGQAYYQRGELHRLRGELDRADEAYRQAAEWGSKPQPGLALLRLAQGDVDSAVVSLRRTLDEAVDTGVRSRLLSAYVEVLLAAGDVEAASVAASELDAIAVALNAPFLSATSACCAGGIHLAEGHADDAMALLEDAREIWREIEAPYEEARCRVLIALASRMRGDDETARLELDASRRTFERLGAMTDVARVDELAHVDELAGQTRSKGPRQLTGRELEVLALVATGKTNRAIADALGLSEKTVARHISNIFTKLGLSSRAAATAYAYQQRLV